MMFTRLNKIQFDIIEYAARRSLKRISTSTINLIPRGTNRDPEVLESLSKDDIAINAKIEEDLFLNNQSKYSPVVTDEILEQFKVKSTTQIKKSTHNDKNDRKYNPFDKNKIEIINDTNIGVGYTKLGLNNNLLSKVMIEGRLKRRNGESIIIVEGRRLIREAINSGLKIRKLIFSEKEKLIEIKDDIQQLSNHDILKVPKQDLRVWSTLTTCPGLLATFERPGNIYEPFKTNNIDGIKFPITIICDNIREPNNLGSIIRSCAGVSCEQIIMIKGCCDPWDSKALRGGCGGQFYTKIINNIKWNDIHNYLPDNFNLFIAENNKEKLNITDNVIEYNNMQLSINHNVIIVGGETHGISESAYSFFSQHHATCLNISLANQIESLNAACAITIILFEMRRQLLLKGIVNCDERQKNVSLS